MNVYTFYSQNMNGYEEEHLGSPCVDGSVILHSTLKKGVDCIHGIRVKVQWRGSMQRVLSNATNRLYSATTLFGNRNVRQETRSVCLKTGPPGGIHLHVRP